MSVSEYGSAETAWGGASWMDASVLVASQPKPSPDDALTPSGDGEETVCQMMIRRLMDGSVGIGSGAASLDQ
jgi:hypothetical protein